MKITLVTLAAFAALIGAPIASRASDKEVQNARYPHACKCPHRQVALFVSGRAIGDRQSGPQFQNVSKAQTGQGGSITFFTGNR